MKKIGIFGGSFNPIHVGHITLAHFLKEQCALDEVWLMVSPQNPQKKKSDLLDDHRRYELAQKALREEEGLKACDYEFHLPKPSYTWNTLQSLEKDFPDHSFVLLIGADNWAHFERWYHWKDILRNYDVVVYPRGDRKGTVEAGLLPVSSTEIRRRVKMGDAIDALVPEVIARDVTRYYQGL